jgi:Zn finger protein HypA/HybF involved in hydrogenase expression
MSSWVEATIGYQKDDFEQTCDCCGAVFQVVVPGQSGHEEPEEYYCPECHKEFKCRASNSPRVSLISKRTDGLHGRCAE